MLNFNLFEKPFIYFSLLLFGFMQAISIAAQPDVLNNDKHEQVKTISRNRGSSDPYCGLYCIYTVMKIADKKIDLPELIKPEYIGSVKGSSMKELKKAAEDHGMHAYLAGNLTSRELRNSPCPVILHTKFNLDKKEYDHFILFLRKQDDKAVIFDPPEPIETIPFRELAARWDGNGMIISDTPIDIGGIYGASRKQFTFYVAIAILIILIVHRYKRRWMLLQTVISVPRSLGIAIAQSVGFLLIALLCGMIYHFVNEEGFLSHPNATASVQQAHAIDFIPKINTKKVGKLLTTKTIFIDARYKKDFDAGHLDGATNIPVDTNDVYRHDAMAKISKDSKIVVYCQSAGCPYAGIISKKLQADGFNNIAIFKGGWNEWEIKNNDNRE